MHKQKTEVISHHPLMASCLGHHTTLLSVAAVYKEKKQNHMIILSLSCLA